MGHKKPILILYQSKTYPKERNHAASHRIAKFILIIFCLKKALFFSIAQKSALNKACRKAGAVDYKKVANFGSLVCII